MWLRQKHRGWKSEDLCFSPGSAAVQLYEPGEVVSHLWVSVCSSINSGAVYALRVLERIPKWKLSVEI